jgi:lysophospholipase L1-like esterase
MTTVQHEWLAFGDSITQDAFAVDLTWKERLGTQAPTPVNAGVRGETTSDALARVDRLLADHPQARYVGVAFGTNDVWGRATVETYRVRMQAIVDRIRAASKVPVLATIPYSPDSELDGLPAFNQAIAELQTANDLPQGPDLYTLIKANESYLRPDGVHMTPEGSQAIQRAWADVAARLSW